MTLDDSRAAVFSHLPKIIKYGRRSDIEPFASISGELATAVNEWLDNNAISSNAA